MRQVLHTSLVETPAPRAPLTLGPRNELQPAANVRRGGDFAIFYPCTRVKDAALPIVSQNEPVEKLILGATYSLDDMDLGLLSMVAELGMGGAGGHAVLHAASEWPTSAACQGRFVLAL